MGKFGGIKSLVLGIAAFAGLLPISGSAASAADPATSQIVFSNGGRIVSINANGSGRQVLASRFSKIENTAFGYQDPVPSPDGSRIAFEERHSGDDYDGYVADILVAKADGTGMVKVLNGDRKNYYSSPSWTPDGKRIIVAYHWRQGRQNAGGIVSVNADGTDRKLIYKPKNRTNIAGFKVVPAVGSPVMSPDGTKILFDDKEEQSDSSGRLTILDLASRKQKVIGQYSLGGSWSPDGSRVVYSKNNTGDDEVCGGTDNSGSSYCLEAGELFVVNSDGTGAKNLLPGEGHEMVPDWSADGSRIVFAGNQNVPTSTDAFEVYSVKPDGSCLSWLTNGTPASVSPSWSDASRGDTNPASCGDNGLNTLQEVTLTPKVRGLTVHNWLGDDFQGQLFSGRLGPVPGEHFTSLSYLDCSQFNPKRCGGGFTTLEFSTCAIGNSISSFIGNQKVRGVPTFASEGDGTTHVAAFTGESLLLIMHETNNRYFSNRQLLRGIRPFGSTSNPKKLPPPVYSALAIRRMNKVIRVQRRTGSVELTAKRLGMKPRMVRRTLKLKPTLLRYGPIRTVKCPKR